MAWLGMLRHGWSFGAGCDQGLIRRWFTVISVLRLDILKWTTKQAKQASAGLPLLTLLTCMETDKQMLANVDGMVDLLQRQLKVRKIYSMHVSSSSWFLHDSHCKSP